MPEIPNCFKAYDIRGRVPDELDAGLARRIGRAAVAHLGGRRFCVGRDIRDSSPELAAAVAAGLTDAGADVQDLGLCGTEQVYFATFSRKLDGGVMVTASHNPVGYNGLKIVREQARPVSGDSGLRDIGALAVGGGLEPAAQPGTVTAAPCDEAFVRFLLDLVDPASLPPLKIVVNAGNGCAGPILDRLEPALPVSFVRVNHEPDGSFPNGVPNPLLPGNRAATADAVRAHGADLGLAWDGDFDRCFFFDESGAFVEGYYLVGLLARAALRRAPGASVVHDPRLVWNTRAVVEAGGGVAVQHKAGHAFIKERMRAEDAVYGGEMSAHHYFREFAYCDSGMIPWLFVLQEMAATGKPLSALVAEMQRDFPASGEINRRVADPAAVLAAIEKRYGPEARELDRTDGLSFDMGQWRFNLRASNTEPLLRLNVEARGDADLMRRRTDEVLAVLRDLGAEDS